VSDVDDLVAALIRGDPGETVPLDIVTAMANAALAAGWENLASEWIRGEPAPNDPHVKQLREEFGNTATIWGRTGDDAWTTIVGLFYHCGWTPPK
jgi:hypothetical protein